MLLLCNEIKELDTNYYLFRFVNTAAEAKCEMQWEEQNNTADELKEEENIFNEVTVKIHEETEVTRKEAISNYPLHNVIETKCTIEC